MNVSGEVNDLVDITNQDILIQKWLFVKQQLRSYYNENIYENWIEGLEFVEINGNQVMLKASSRFVRDWIINNYLATIRKYWQVIDSNIIAVTILTEHNITTNEQNTYQAKDAIVENSVAEIKSSFDLTNFNLDPKFTFENFVVGISNQFAYAAAKAIASMDNRLDFNPLFFYSPVGHGKTHLIQAIATEINAKFPDKKVCYLTAERFMFQFVKSLKSRDIISFKEFFRGVDVLIIDDLQFICGKESTQEEFFHTFNALVEDNKKIILACDRSPNDLDGLDFRFKSRLISGLVADIALSDIELRSKIIIQKAAFHNLILSQEIVNLLAHKITASIREVEGAINKIAAYSNFLGCEITIDSINNLLKDLFRTSSRNINITAIQQKIAEFYKIKVSDLASTSRQRDIARPRQLAMYLAKKYTSLSLVEIGKKFGGRDHTTVMHALKQIEKLLSNDNEMFNDLSNIERNLAS